MKKILLALGISVLLAAAPASAAKWKIKDNYVGGGYVDGGPFTQTSQGMYGDVISGYSTPASINEYDIDNMRVKIDNKGNVTVTVKTDYDPNISGNNIDYGDLFISTDGWAPAGSGSSNHNQDTFYNTGTSWDYVFDTSSGNFYQTSDNAFLLSQDFFGNAPDTWYRKDQVVQIDPDALDNSVSNPITTGRFLPHPNGRGFIKYYGFNLEDMGLSLDESFDLAFRWTMTCANDVIEGEANWNPNPVPEPGTMLMFGLGLLGIGAVGRKRFIP